MLSSIRNDQAKIKFDTKDEIEDENLLKTINDYDKKMLSYVGNLYNILAKPKLDLVKLDKTVKMLSEYNESNQYLYLDSLLHPERNRDSKIPSPIPVPSCSFQLHNTVTLTTNSSGNLMGCFNPYFLYQTFGTDNPMYQLSPTIPSGSNTFNFYKLGWVSTFFFCNDDALDGRTVLDTTKLSAVNLSQGIPNVYDQYRLVSASLVIKYIGRLDIASGVIGGAIAYDEVSTIGSAGVLADNVTLAESATGFTSNPFLTKYTNFDAIIDSFYHQENLCLEGLRQVYFPLDNEFEEYTKLLNYSSLSPTVINTSIQTPAALSLNVDYDKYMTGFNFLFYVLGAPPSTACFKVDIYCNFECLPNSQFLNYMPVQINNCCLSSAEKTLAIKRVQERPVMKLSENPVVTSVKKKSILESLKDKFGSYLPSITKLIKTGLVTAIPALKPGLALAGAMIGSDAMEEEDVE